MARKLSPLVASVVLEINQWSAGIKQMQRDQKALADSLKPLSEGLSNIGKPLLAVGGLVSAAMVGMAKSAANLGDQLLDASKRTGIATETLSAYRLLADQSGTSFSALSGGLAKLSKSIYDAATGSKEQAKVFEALGIAVKNTDGTIRNTAEVFPLLVERLSRMQDGTEKVALAQKLMGKSASELIPLINEGTEGIRKAEEATQKYGTALTRAQAEAGDRFNDSLEETKEAMRGLAVSVGNQLLPALTELIKKANDWIATIAKFAREHETIVKAFGAITLAITGSGGLLVGLGLLVKSVSNLLPLLDKLVPALKASTTAMGAFNLAAAATPWALAVGGGIALGVGLVKLSDAWDQAKTAQALATRSAKEHLGVMDQMIKRRHDDENAARMQADAIDLLMGRSKDAVKVARELTDEEKKLLELRRQGQAAIATIQAEQLRKDVEAYRKAAEDRESAAEHAFKVAMDLAKKETEGKIDLLNKLAIEEARLRNVELDGLILISDQVAELAAMEIKHLENVAEMGPKVLRDVEGNIIGVVRETAEVSKKAASATEQAWATAVGNITSDFAKGLADVIFEGRNFGKTMVDIAKNTAKSMFEAFLVGLLAPLTSKLAGLGSTLGGAIFGGGGKGGGKISLDNMGLPGLESIGGAIGGGAGAGAAGFGMFGALGPIGIGAMVAPMLIQGISKIGAGRRAADEIVKSQNALVDAVGKILNDATLTALNKSKIVENLFTGFDNTLSAFSAGGGANAKVANQAAATLLPWQAQVRAGLARDVTAAGGDMVAAPAGPQTVNNLVFNINVPEGPNARATGAHFREEIIPILIDAIQANTQGLTATIAVAMKSSLPGVVTAA